MAEYEMDGWHHRLNAQEFGWTPGAGDGQGGLGCCSPRGHKESDRTEGLNGTESQNEKRRNGFQFQVEEIRVFILLLLEVLSI